MNHRSLFAVLLLCASATACSKPSNTPPPEPEKALFDSVPTAARLEPMRAEISGIADSKVVPQHLWGIEDSGHPPHLFLINHNGAVVKTLYVNGAQNVDWEEMTRVADTLYIGDIGDNNGALAEHIIYKFAEPGAQTDTIFAVDKIRFQYADGRHNAEAFLVDADGSIYLITKNLAAPAGVYKIAAPVSYTTLNTAVKVGAIEQVSQVVASAQSSNGSELLVKTYAQLLYFKRASGQTIEQALQGTPVKLPYRVEPQGEAVTFDRNDAGYFTLSERGLSTNVNLYYYKRQ